VLGGDFNAGVTFDKDRIGGLRSHSLLFDRLEAFGLKSVIPYRDASDQTVTWKGSGEKQSDYVFVSEELAYRDPELRWHNELSDHAAIMVDVDLPEPTGL
jgi:endonuclease/exonuclease/phosphatase family metal-dependent hydrolase